MLKESSSTTKLRIVYDNSSGKPSLNDCLYRGKVYAGQFDKSIMAILARARLMNNVLVMDLQSAFLQIVLDEEDRDSNRLLWPVDPLNSDIPQVLRFTRVTFGIISSPYLLGATVEYHLKKYEEKLAKEICQGSYVDNFIIQVARPEDIRPSVETARRIFWEGGFNCMQFGSNCRREIEQLPEEWKETKTNISMLGIAWDTLQDSWTFKFPQTGDKISKRTILSAIASLFDPNGYCSPTLLPAKRFQGEVWKTGFGWDEELPEELKTRWKAIVLSWQAIEITMLFNKTR